MATPTQLNRPPLNKIDIQLMGRSYTLTCEAGEEKRVETLAGYLDSKLRLLAGSTSSATESRLFMLAALMLADEVFDLKAGAHNKASAEQENVMVAAVEHITARLHKITQRLQD